ncbi:MAG: Fe-S cluster protein [bacterium]|nr:iron-sulfur cluster assembly scaffold protein [Candidatus Microgenomates bacterium CPR3]MCQ3944640.1 Fe-S cluster protein [bacterium]RIK51171.1 MAG: Fe-S cluster protein [Candidatus Microgenomates bacterium]
MDLYKEEVMDHYEHPRNVGEIESPNLQGRDSNASCGDMVQFQLAIENGIIKNAKWQGIGCAITTAAASKLSEWLVNKNIEDVKSKSEKELTKLAIGFEVNPGRLKCLTLPVRVVKRIWES